MKNIKTLFIASIFIGLLLVFTGGSIFLWSFERSTISTAFTNGQAGEYSRGGYSIENIRGLLRTNSAIDFEPLRVYNEYGTMRMCCKYQE